MYRLLRVALVWLTAIGLPGSLNAAEPVPGSFSVTVKGQLKNQVYFTKLAMYSFQPYGSMRQDFWYWESDDNDPIAGPLNSIYGPSGAIVGMTTPPDSEHPSNLDQGDPIQGMNQFHFQPPKTLYGKWVKDGNLIIITWSWGDVEVWKLTWKDLAADSLFKIELVAANYVVGGFYLTGNGAEWTRTPTAVNVGWGFGGPTNGFSFGETVSAAHEKDYTGIFSRFNAWPDKNTGLIPGDTGVHGDVMGLKSGFALTDTQTLRYVKEGDTGCGCTPCIVFHYFAKPPQNPGMLARRVMYTVGHDFNCDGRLREGGHTYSGIEIIDAKDQLRGFVFSDSSNALDNAANLPFANPPPLHTISSLFYLDDGSFEAQYGIDPDVEERVPARRISPGLLPSRPRVPRQRRPRASIPP